MMKIIPDTPVFINLDVYIILMKILPEILFFSFFFNNVISFIQMLATINTPKVQAPFGVSLLHLVLIIQGYNLPEILVRIKLDICIFLKLYFK